MFYYFRGILWGFKKLKRISKIKQFQIDYFRINDNFAEINSKNIK